MNEMHCTADRDAGKASPIVGLVRIIVVLSAVLSFACEKKPAPVAAALDESNLGKVVDFFYHPGKPGPAPSETYKFLSSKTREQVSLDQWKSIQTGQVPQYTVATVLKTVARNRATYGIVSLSEINSGVRTVSTAIWVLEDNRWRRLKLPGLVNDLSRVLTVGDYAAAKAVIAQWLAIDPFSIEVYEAMVFCVEHTGPQGMKQGYRTVPEIIQRALAVNPDDTRALFIAATRAESIPSAQTYLKKLKGTTSYQAAIDYKAAKALKSAGGPQLDNEQLRGDAILLQKLLVLSDMKEIVEFKRLAANDGAFERLRSYLNELDAQDAANYAGRLGIAYLRSGDRERAAQLMDFGIVFGVHSDYLQKLGSMLDKTEK